MRTFDSADLRKASSHVSNTLQPGTALRLFEAHSELTTSNTAGTARTSAGCNLRQFSHEFWQRLRAHPYAFTVDSMCLTSACASALWQTCASSVSNKPLPEALFHCDYVKDVINIDVCAPSGDLCDEVLVVKRTFTPNRLLLLGPASMIDRAGIEGGKDVACTKLKVAADAAQDAVALIFAHVCGVSSADAALITSLGITAQVLQCVDHAFSACLAWLKASARAWAKQSGNASGRFRLRVSSTSIHLEDAAEGDHRPWLVGVEDVDALLWGTQPQQQVGVKRPRAEEGGAGAGGRPAPGRPSAPSDPPPVRLAIIVPFRDQPEQNRGEQLKRFIAHMPAFLASAPVVPPLAAYHVLIVEQSSDGYKFNRGKLLNIGYHLAIDSGRRGQVGLPEGAHFNAFCFHDVDLLPGPPLGPWYARSPTPRPVHIGSAWARYPYDHYVGGILTLDEDAVKATNGFPNDFWGWGGEDDELSTRLRENKLLPLVKPSSSLQSTPGALVDMEEQLIAEMGGERAGTSLKDGGRTEWRNMWKREGIARHESTWRVNGVASLTCEPSVGAGGSAGSSTAGSVPSGRYSIVATRQPAAHVTVVTVDLHASVDPHSQKQEHTEPIVEAGRT